ncbi:hypothetical protein RclHR1_10650008 [Rhizophagus clarus]|uniref:Uncharacterized protein n=1 Tax=Rhizophagus clarus TaxID=94130 RepID=A0A2Z6QTG9_9GLOM|nr:hypothetical protein RclHR1_10650008 [Rhizophagus clarus]
MSTSVIDYVQKNLRDINFFAFARNFRYQKTEEKLAWNHYLSALGNLSVASDSKIRTYAKRRKEEAMSLKLRKGQLEDFWLKVESENAQASFEVGMRCIQLKNQVVDAERHHRQFSSSKITNDTEDNILPTKKNLNDEIDNFFQGNPEQKSTKKRQKSSYERGSSEADNDKDKVQSSLKHATPFFISEENDDSGFFSLGLQPISFCNAEGLADGSETKVSEEEYAYLQEILNEDVKFPTLNKRGNEIEEDVSTRKKTKTFNDSFDEFVDSGETSGETTDIADEVSDSELLDQNSGESSDVNRDDEDFSGHNNRMKMEEVKRRKLMIAKKLQDEMKAEYSAKYRKLCPENKWKLPFGKFVEDILYEYTINLDHESYLHSFIIDISDETIMNLFSEPDQKHIREYNIPSEPQVDDTLLDFLLLYRQNNPQDLRKVINIDIDLSSYNPRENYDYYYVHEVFFHLLSQYELRPQDFSNPHLEGWFKTKLWSIIVDNCFLDVLDAEFIRGEGCSRASGQRKNKGRKDPKVRKRVGHKCDGILRKLGTLKEYAISEEGKLWDGEDRTKHLTDGFKKLPKTMRDTLVQKVKKFNLSFVISHQLEAVGFLYSGCRIH